MCKASIAAAVAAGVLLALNIYERALWRIGRGGWRACGVVHTGAADGRSCEF